MTVFCLDMTATMPAGAVVIDTTSRATGWSRGLSPFYLGPVELYGGMVAQKVENGWQYSKLYAEHADAQANPTDAYWAWARRRRRHRGARSAGLRAAPTLALLPRALDRRLQRGLAPVRGSRAQGLELAARPRRRVVIDAIQIMGATVLGLIVLWAIWVWGD